MFDFFSSTNSEVIMFKDWKASFFGKKIFKSREPDLTRPDLTRPNLTFISLVKININWAKSGQQLCSINANFDFLCTKKVPKMTYYCIVELNQKNCRCTPKFNSWLCHRLWELKQVLIFTRILYYNQPLSRTLLKSTNG